MKTHFFSELVFRWNFFSEFFSEGFSYELADVDGCTLYGGSTGACNKVANSICSRGDEANNRKCACVPGYIAQGGDAEQYFADNVNTFNITCAPIERERKCGDGTVTSDEEVRIFFFSRDFYLKCIFFSAIFLCVFSEF